MPEELIIDADCEILLERVRQRFNIPSDNNAAEWLLRRRLRRSAQRISGRGGPMPTDYDQRWA